MHDKTTTRLRRLQERCEPRIKDHIHYQSTNRQQVHIDQHIGIAALEANRCCIDYEIRLLQTNVSLRAVEQSSTYLRLHFPQARVMQQRADTRLVAPKYADGLCPVIYKRNGSGAGRAARAQDHRFFAATIK